MPDSSPLATTIAFQILSALETPSTHELVVNGINYFVQTFDKEHQVWMSRPKEVNLYPHTPWWEFKELIDEDLIQANYANPTAEIVGVLWEYQSLVHDSFLNEITDITISRIENHKEPFEMHDLFCILRLCKRLPKDKQSNLIKLIKHTLNLSLEKNKEQWGTYVLTPLMAVESKQSPAYQMIDLELINLNLDYLIEIQDEVGAWNPTWPSFLYEESHWKKAQSEWQGIITLKYLKIFKNFNRLS